MSEIADELERMASEFDRSADTLEDKRSGLKHAAAGFMLDGEQTAYVSAARRLRERAAELRTQRSGPTYKAQPKPADVRGGQWWMWDADNGTSVADPFRIEMQAPKFKSDDADVIGVYLSDGKIDNFDDEDLLTDSDWIYLGNGERPAT